MNRDRILDLFEGVKEDYVLDAIGSRRSARRTQIRSKRFFLIAAVLGLTALLVGCGIAYVLKLQNLKLGDQQVTQARWEDDTGNMLYETVSQQVLTFSGLKGTPNYEAAREWYEFKKNYDPEYVHYHENKNLESPYRAPAEYSLYNIYTPEMQDKIDEITAKHGLKLQGRPVEAFNDETLFDYLGLDSVLLADAPAACETFNASYYDGGWFHVDMDMKLEDNPDWPFQFLCSLYYSPKDCFDSSVCELNDTDDWQEWNYTTASGAEVLVIRSPSVWISWVFCDRGDATITLRIETILEWYGDNGVKKTPMTDDQLCQVLDAIDFSLQPQPGDPVLLGGPPASKDLTQTRNGYGVTVKDVFTDGMNLRVLLGITAPEGTDLEQYMGHGYNSLRFDGVQFTSAENAQIVWNGMSHGPRSDTDGKANTVDYDVTVRREVKEGIAFREGSVWKLCLDDLLVQSWDQELHQWEQLWETEGIWNFELPLTQGDWRELEFVSEPVTTSACIGWDREGNDVFQDVTITSFRLRAFGGECSSNWDLGQLDFSNTRKERFPTVVLADGSEIQLQGDLGVLDDAQRIPLDEVDHILLIDGTKLYPQNKTE